MKREDLLNFNFDWKNEKKFKKALAESGLSEKEKLRLRDERMHRLELEEIKEFADGYDEDEQSDEVSDTKQDKKDKESKQSAKKEENSKKGKNKNSTDNSKKSAKKKASAQDGVIVRIKQSYPFGTLCVSFLLSCFIMILPFISYLHEEQLSMLTAKYFSSESGIINDWFLYQKEFCVVLCAVLLVLYFITDRCFMEHKYKKLAIAEKPLRLPLVMCGYYAALLILSGMLSRNKEVVMMGMVKQYEGLLGVLGYLVIFLAAMNYFNNTKSLKIFMNTMTILALAAGIFAFMEYKGHPLQETDIMAHLMAPKEKYELASQLHSSSSNVHITFFNSNYFGSFCGLMFPMTAAVALGQKNLIKKIVGLIAAALIVMGAIFSNSTGGLYSVAGGFVLLLAAYVFYWIKGRIDRKASLIAVASVAVAGICGLTLLTHYNEDFAERFKKVVNNGSSNSNETREERRDRFDAKHFVLTEIRVEGDSVYLTDYKDSTVQVRIYIDDTGSTVICFYEGSGDELAVYFDEESYRFIDERFRNISFKFSDTNKLYCDLGYESKIVLQYGDGTFKPFVHGTHTVDSITTYQGPGFFADKLRMGTGRGFIWGSTISMLKNCIFLGYGSGNFVCYFPQYDYVSLLEVYNTPAIIVNKPHSMYLGIAVDSGLFSLVAVLVMFVAFIIKGFRACILHPVKDKFMHMRLGVYISSIAFMLVGIVNDSYVCVSPVFWFIFGIAWYSVSGCEVVDTD